MKDNNVLDKRMNTRSLNLQFLRYVAALLVVIGHAFVLCDSKHQEMIYRLTGNEVTLGRIAVAIFLFASGLFVARSIEKKHGFAEYFKARCIRIFPLLWVVVVLTIIMGACITKESLSDYLTSPQTWKYLLNGVFIMQHDLPGVFQQNYYGSVVNGALWTLPVEVVCYIVCFICYHMGIMKRKVMKWTIPFCGIGAVVAALVNKILHNSLIEDTLCLCIIFYIGMLYYVFRDRIVYRTKWFVILFVILVVTIILNVSWLGILCAFPYYLSWFFFADKQVSEKAAQAGDYSYAMYLCAFPIQQLFIYVSGGNMNPYLNIVLAGMVSFIIAFFLVEWVEKPLINRINKR